VCDSNRRTWDDAGAATPNHTTTFTRLRRLLLLRLLDRGKISPPQEMTTSANILADAARRHLDKLRRRGVAASVLEAPGAWTIGRNHQPPCRQMLLTIVLGSVFVTGES
jgi:hypothetical protein